MVEFVGPTLSSLIFLYRKCLGSQTHIPRLTLCFQSTVEPYLPHGRSCLLQPGITYSGPGCGSVSKEQLSY